MNINNIHEKIENFKLKCKKCGLRWIPHKRNKEVKICPRCKLDWRKPKIYKTKNSYNNKKDW